MKACKDCEYCEVDEFSYIWCTHPKSTESIKRDHYNGTFKIRHKDIYAMRMSWPLFGGCGEHARFFEPKQSGETE